MGASVFMELAVSACATTFTPGPNNILLLSSTSTFGFHPGRIVAFALVMALCAGTGNLIWATLGIDNRNVLVNGIVKDTLRYTKVNAG